jgi:hypothetical protein
MAQKVPFSYRAYRAVLQLGSLGAPRELAHKRISLRFPLGIPVALVHPCSADLLIAIVTPRLALLT